MSTPDFHCYWGKSRRDSAAKGDAYHLLSWHCLDVAACGNLMVKQNRYGVADILAELGMTGDDAARWIAWLFACHDIGKFASGFQKLASHPDSPLLSPVTGVIYGARHDSLGYYLWEKLISRWEKGEVHLFPNIPREAREDFSDILSVWMKITTGHHGQPPDETADGGPLSFKERDYAAAEHYLTELNKLFSMNDLPGLWLDKTWRKKLKQQSWFLAGIVTLADWLGSNEHYFPFLSSPLSLDEYWTIACSRAGNALSHLPASSLTSSFSGHHALFPFINTLTPLQQCASSINIDASGPQLFICEDVTGAGKTEAAMIITHRLFSAKKGAGLYVGLPTMATANAMYRRLGSAYHALFDEGARPSLVLAHGGRHMSAAFSESVWQERESGNDNYTATDLSASSECHSWFADSRKKALLAEVGVGTIDQLLMAVMPFRHQSLRLAGMRGKVLLLDEVHAYDSYMVRLLEGLLKFHAAQGGSAVILSATLPAGLREKLIAAFNAGAGFSPALLAPDAGYPWLSHLSSTGLSEQLLETRKEVRRCVSVNWIHDSDRAIDIIYQAVRTGECICWIRNTVDDALTAFRRLMAEGKIPEENLLLFHSRFAFGDRMAIEEKTLDWFSKDASPKQRHGKVLIATQVVEQSLDLDLDNMISDLAPVDLLIQRAGRLQRHIRDAQGRCKASLPDERPAPVLHLLAPEWQEQAERGWLGDELRGTGFVYPDHGALWRTQALLRQKGQIRMPEDARFLVDGVYEELIPVPPGLEAVSVDVFAGILSKRAIASQNLLHRDKGYDRESSDFLWDDEREFSTRLGEISTDIYLAWLDDEGKLQPMVREDDFQWEKSRVQVRLTWWQKHQGNLNQPEQSLLETFRKATRRPSAQVVLVSEEGEAPYYSRRCGLTG
nr:CRISPR-associated helicase/endonuclease Cas3 [Erwinia oleae]